MISRDACIACGVCVGMCPVGAIKYADDGKPQIDPQLCIECGSCVGACPTNAIDISDVASNK